MMAPFHTDLLKHQPDHLRPLTQAERDAEKMMVATRPTFREFLTQVFASAPRHGQEFSPRSGSVALCRAK